MLVLDSSKTLVETVNALTRRVSNGGSSGQTTAATLASLGPQVTRLLTCLQGVRKLLDAEYVSAGLAATPVVAGVIRVLTRLAQAALLPMAWFAAATGAAAADPAARAACGAHLASLAHAVADIVKELAQGVSATQFAAVVKDESGKPVALAPVLLDAILATSSVTAPYSVVLPAPPQPPPSPQQQQRGASGGGRRTPPAATPRGGVTPRTSGGGEAQQAPAPRPQYVAAPLVLSQQSATLLDNAAVSLLVAATLLLRKAPAGKQASDQFLCARFIPRWTTASFSDGLCMMSVVCTFCCVCMCVHRGAANRAPATAAAHQPAAAHSASWTAAAGRTAIHGHIVSHIGRHGAKATGKTLFDSLFAVHPSHSSLYLVAYSLAVSGVKVSIRKVCVWSCVRVCVCAGARGQCARNRRLAHTQ